MPLISSHVRSVLEFPGGSDRASFQQRRGFSALAIQTSDMTSTRFSVVMAAYSGDRPAPLNEALESLFRQSRMPAELVLVVDGPVGKEIDEVICAWEKLRSEIRVRRLPENVGRGRARNAGIELTQHDIVFVMDSDDRALFSRFGILMGVFERNPELGFVTGWAREFDHASGRTLSVKRCPESDAAIRRALRFTNVICNPACGFRKHWWSAVGGYPDYADINEDYLFCLRLVKAGCRFYCVQEPVLDFRIDQTMYGRRRGWKVFRSDLRFRAACFKEGHIGIFEVIIYTAAVAIRRLAPASIGLLIQRGWRRFGY